MAAGGADELAQAELFGAPPGTGRAHGLLATLAAEGVVVLDFRHGTAVNRGGEWAHVLAATGASALPFTGDEPRKPPHAILPQKPAWLAP